MIAIEFFLRCFTDAAVAHVIDQTKGGRGDAKESREGDALVLDWQDINRAALKQATALGPQESPLFT